MWALSNKIFIIKIKLKKKKSEMLFDHCQWKKQSKGKIGGRWSRDQVGSIGGPPKERPQVKIS